MNINILFTSLAILISLQFNVYAALLTRYSIGSNNYDQCKQACEDSGYTLATKAQILSEISALGGDSWTPVIDTYNDWLQIGGRTWTYGLLYTEINGGTLGTPSWGTRSQSRRFKDYFYCNAEGSSGTTPTTTEAPVVIEEPTTTIPEVPITPITEIDCCAKRCRKAWSTLTQTERNKYIYGFKELADQGIIQSLSTTHRFSAEHSRGSANSYFLPWHRVFIELLEDAIRGLGDDYKCFAMPYWDWSAEATPLEVYNGERELLITNSGIGIDSHGSCMIDSGSPFDYGSYIPASIWHDDGVEDGETRCMIREIEYESGWGNKFGYCWFKTPDDIMNMIGNTDDYGTFAGALESNPHSYPHICVGGNMGTFYSPDDPIFYLHHTFVDYIWALWQVCHDYEGVTSIAAFNGIYEQEMSYTPYTSDKYTPESVINLAASDIIYEKGPLFSTIAVEESSKCPGTVNTDWFTDFLGRRRRLLRGNILRRRRRRAVRAMNRGTGRRSRIRFRPFRRAQRALQELLGQEEELDIEVEECTNGRNACPMPDYFEDCKSMSNEEIDSLTIQDIISMDGINDCQKAAREGIYIWAKEMGYLRALCNGCLDPVCDQSLKYDRCAVGN